MFTTFVLVLLLLLPALSFFSTLSGLFNRHVHGLDPAEQSQRIEKKDEMSGPNKTGTFEPSPLDVIVVKAMLQEALKLPLEVILPLLDFAEYWPHTTSVLDRQVGARGGDRTRENRFLLRTQPLGLIKPTHYDKNLYTHASVPQQPPVSADSEYSSEQFQEWIGGPTNTVLHPCRKIAFTIHSHDQGYSNERADRGTYHGSWTWFEAGLERFDKNRSPVKSQEAGQANAPLDPDIEASSPSDAPGRSLPDPYLPVRCLRSIQPEFEPTTGWRWQIGPHPNWTIQHNVTAIRKTKVHRVEWSWNDRDALSSEELQEMGRGQHTANGEFVRSMKLGDVVTVWAKARFPAWENTVEKVQVDVYWAL